MLSILSRFSQVILQPAGALSFDKPLINPTLGNCQDLHKGSISEASTLTGGSAGGLRLGLDSFGYIFTYPAETNSVEGQQRSSGRRSLHCDFQTFWMVWVGWSSGVLHLLSGVYNTKRTSFPKTRFAICVNSASVVTTLLKFLDPACLTCCYSNDEDIGYFPCPFPLAASIWDLTIMDQGTPKTKGILPNTSQLKILANELPTAFAQEIKAPNKQQPRGNPYSFHH